MKIKFDKILWMLRESDVDNNSTLNFNIWKNVISVTNSLEKEYSLSHEPLTNSTSMFVNGLFQDELYDYTINWDILTLDDSFNIRAGDTISVSYFY